MRPVLWCALVCCLAGCATGPQTPEQQRQSAAIGAMLLQMAQPGGYRAPVQQRGAMLKRQYESGFNRVCIYDGIGGEIATTVPVMQFCPQSL